MTTTSTEKFCEILHCYEPQSGETLQFRPPGHARHEGTFLYRFCAEHTDKHRHDTGYTVVVWDKKTLRFVPAEVLR